MVSQQCRHMIERGDAALRAADRHGAFGGGNDERGDLCCVCCSSTGLAARFGRQ
jgi:hypothetical protein